MLAAMLDAKNLSPLSKVFIAACTQNMSLLSELATVSGTRTVIAEVDFDIAVDDFDMRVFSTHESLRDPKAAIQGFLRAMESEHLAPQVLHAIDTSENNFVCVCYLLHDVRGGGIEVGVAFFTPNVAGGWRVNAPGGDT
jgi:hypothetical protein